MRYFQFDMLAQPLFLLLLAAVAVLLFAEWTARAPGAMTISTGETLAGLESVRGTLARRSPALLRALGLTLLVIALAGPLNGFQIRNDRASVIDVVLCVDLSGSMQTEDFNVGGERRNRLDVAKLAVHDFIEDRRQHKGDRFGVDRIGLITFAGFAWTACPLTLDYDVLQREVDNAQVTADRRKDGTAIGSAIGLGVRRLSQSEAKSKVIILLTDGINNAGELDPQTAAQVARDYGVRVYTIGAGSTEPQMMGLFGMQRSEPIDEEALRKIAETTGGKYYRATNTESLKEAYKEINELEATEIDAGQFYEYKDAYMPYLLSGAFALVASIFVRRRWFEVIP